MPAPVCGLGEAWGCGGALLDLIDGLGGLSRGVRVLIPALGHAYNFRRA